MPRLGVRKDAAYKAVGTAPSINKTPVGGAVVPVAYPVQHDLSNSVGNAATVRFNGDPAHKLNASTQTSTRGDAPGTAGGVRSGTVGGQVKPTGASRTVRVEGKPLVRDGDPCTLNGGNCPGVYVAGGGPGGKVEAARPVRDPDPPAKLKPAEQRAWYQKVGDWVGEQAHNAGQAVAHPIEGLKGAAKGLGNIPGDVWNLVAMGATAQAGGEMMNSAAMQSAFGGGSAADAEATMKLGQQMATSPGAFAPTVPQAFKMSNAAQEGGDLIATLIPSPKGLVGGVGKLGAKVVGKEAAKLSEKEAAKLAAKEAEKAAAKKAEEEAARAAEKKAGGAPEGPGDGAKVKPKRVSLREKYLGRTPGKNSRTGKEVQARMEKDGTLRTDPFTGEKEFQASNGSWYPLKDADMAHNTDAVTWWNQTGRQYGAQAPEVRSWMLDSKNYTLDYYSLNRSAGARLGETYLPPLK